MKPAQFGKYTLIDKLGRGRCCDVFLAQPDAAADLVVLKRLRSSRTHADELRGQDVPVPADATLALQLHHPNIAETYEVSENDDMPYWVIEHVHGKSLNDVLSAAAHGGGLPIQLGLWIAAAVLRALAYAHGLKDQTGAALPVVHGDVRPHNVFITYTGEVKLLDFCMPRRVLKRAAGSVEMAPDDAFRAPESELGLQDARSDVYSAGRLLAALSAAHGGALSFASATFLGTESTTSAEPWTLFEAPIRAVCERATRLDPSTRHPSAAAMLREVEALLHHVLELQPGRRAAMPTLLAELMHELFGAEREHAEARYALLRAAGAAPLAAAPSPSAPESAMTEPRPSQDDSAHSLAFDHSDLTQTGGIVLVDDEAETHVHAAPLPSEPPPLRPPPLPRPHASVQPTGDDRGTGYALLAVLLASMALIGTRLAKYPGTSADAASSVVAVTAAAEPPAEPAKKAEPDLRLCGSNTMGAELAPAWIKGLFTYKANAESVVSHRDLDSELVRLASVKGDSELEATISARGSATAFQKLAEGSCDVGMSSRAIAPAELETLAALGRGDLSAEANEHIVGIDGVAVIVHPSNPLAALDTAALRDIFSGKLKDWSELGGAPGEIHVHARDENSGTFDTFKEIVLRQSSLAAAAQRFALSEALSDAVAGDPAAIGFIGLPYVRSAKALAVSEPGSAALLPTRFTVATESYPLSRRLYLYTTDQPRSPWVTELINFALSSRGQRAVAESHFMNLSLVTDAPPCDTQRCPPRYAALVAAAGRISVDFRFKPGSNQPDNRARRDMDRLSSFLRDFHEPKLMLLGFSDNLGDPAQNVQLSRERAETIANDLVTRGVHPSVVTGFGAELPIASNDGERGRARNRRVEVWFEHD